MARTLKAPNLTDEASVGGALYHTDNNGTVDVADDDAAALLAVGYIDQAVASEIPTGSVPVRHDDGAASCSWGGETYEADGDGRFSVPAAAVADLAAHGFTAVEPSAVKAAAAE